MPVPSLVTDLSATIASNSPAGSDNVFPDLDGYLRSLSGFLASIRDNSGNGWVSPYLPLAGGTVTGPATFSSTLALNGALSGTGLTTYLASPPAIGGTAAAAVSSTNLAYTGTLTGGTGVVALGTNQFYKDASGNVGIGTATPGSKLDVVGTAAISGAVTLSGGTANGVPYLNGSKVLTTGSALTFDGANLGMSNGASVSIGGNVSLYGDANQTVIRGRVTNGTIFQDSAGSEQMRLTSTGLGIGTNLPSQKLEILTAVSASTPAAIFRSAAGVGNTGGLAFYANDTNANARNWYLVANSNAYGDFVIKVGASQGANPTSGNTVATLDSSGNLGLGVTPSAWGSNTKAFQFTKGSWTGALASALSSDEIVLTRNAYFDNTNYRYVAGSSHATVYQQSSDGQHLWFTAPSGTAGNAISFTQAMTLDASGNLAVGDTSNSAAARLYVKGSGATSGSVAMVVRNSTPSDLLYIRNDGYTGFGLNATAMTLTASGNLGLGTTSPDISTYRTFVQDGTVASVLVQRVGGTEELAIYSDAGITQINVASNPLTFATGGTERARITSGGDLLVGMTTSSGKISTSFSSTQTCFYAETSNNDATYIRFNRSGITNVDHKIVTSAYQIVNASAGVSLAIGGTSWGAVSDERRKDIIEPIVDASSKVSTLRAVIGKYKTDDEGTRRAFLIAQDVQAVLPEAVVENNGDLILQYTDTIPLLVAAIQEQQALITSLTARVASLETQP